MFEDLLGNTVAYGQVRAWIDRLRRAPSVDGFTLPMQLELLDALAGVGDEKTNSAKNEAERLFQLTTAEVRQSVARMVK